MKPSPESPSSTETAKKKPQLALAIATVVGIGYVPKAPGTLGSLVGLALIALTTSGIIALPLLDAGLNEIMIVGRLVPAVIVFSALAFLILAALGVWSASRVATYEGLTDPQHVIIDEVSGQHLTWLLGVGPRAMALSAAANWKYLLLGFILFRVFDIWKPFPVRQAERLPGGWGIMADDWLAGIYAALGLWLARALGL